MPKLKLCSFNVRGINDKKKRCDVFAWLKRKHCDIYLLQETHSTKEIENSWQSEWGYKMFSSSHSSKSRGVAILLNNTFQFSVIKTITDSEGRFVLIKLLINDQPVVIANVYGPNDDDPTFFDIIQTKLGEFDNSTIILGGDFNVVQDYTKDTLNLINRQNPKSHEAIKNLKNELDLYDPWRILNPETKMFTWHNSVNKQSRLDYFLTSLDLLNYIETTDIKPGYRSDHSIIYMLISLDFKPRGPGLWKFNNSLLQDDAYINEIKELINLTLKQYQDRNSNETNPMTREYTICDKTLFEVLKMEIRGKTIGYSAAKKKKSNQEENILDEKIDKLHATYTKDPSEINLTNLTNAQNNLKILREKKIDGIITRAKARWHLEGERNSKYFCQLEKKNFIEKTINQLIKDNGEMVTEQADILREQKEFYKNLYMAKETQYNDETDKTFFPEDKTIQSLTIEESVELEKEITVTECFDVLKNMKSHRSPGSDGFTVEFYLFFWNDLKYSLVRSFKNSYKDNILSDSQKLGIITCLPKPGKQKEYMKNWRPITLLNVDYKIISGVIANRMKKYLNNIISDCQKGFVAGRYIGECTRLTSDIIYKMKKLKMSGIILLIDFEKAFDSIDWSFIDKTLKYFNFGESFRRWVKLFYTKIESCVTNNGFCSERFQLGRGVRQGDPLSPYLFILAAEILANALIYNENIKGIKIDNSEFLISQLADDTTLYLENDELSFKTCITILDKFTLVSGLKINYTKTIAITIGMGNIKYDTGNGKEINWQADGRFTLLGIKYNLDEENFTELNYEEKLKEFRKILNSWNSRNLTIYGKTCVLKSLALPKLVHLFSSIPNPPQTIFKDLEKECFRFIWNNGSEKIKRDQMYNSYEDGGFKVPNIKLFCLAQKLMWIKKLIDNSNVSNWKTLFLSDVEYCGGNYIWLVKNKQPSFLSKLNPFWKDVYYAWISLTDNAQDDNKLREPLFFNSHIKINNKPVFFKDWHMSGLRYVNDLINQNGSPYTWQELRTIYNINDNPFRFYSFLHAIPMNWKKRIKECGIKLDEIVDTNIQKLKNLKKPSKYFYLNQISLSKSKPSKAEQKWENLTSRRINETEWQRIYMISYDTTKETKLRSLQLKIIHRILPLNSWLSKCNLTTTSNCDFCLIHKESIEHFFWECNVTKNIWLKLQSWLHSIDKDITLEIDLKKILLGDPKNSSFIEHIKLITKEYIYNSKLKRNTPTFDGLIPYMNYKIKIEKEHLSKQKFKSKWNRKLLDVLLLT